MKLRATVIAMSLAFAATSATCQDAPAQGPSGGGTRLDDVVVSATRAADKLRDLPVSPIIIDEKELARHPNSDLSDVLERAGVMVDRQYYLGGQVVLRGLSGNISGTDVQSDVLMLLNGHRIGTGSLLRFPAKNIMRVEVIRGPAALQYGSSAMGGVVNVITRKADGPLQGYAEAGIGAWAEHDYAGGFWGEFGGLDIAFGGAQMGRHEDYETGHGQTYLGTTTRTRSEANLQLGYTFAENHRIAAIGTFVDLDKFGFTGSIRTMNNVVMGNIPYLNRTSGTGKYLDLLYEGKTGDGAFDWEAKYFLARDEQGGNAAPLAGYENKIDGAQGRVTGRFPQIGAELTLGFDLTNYDFATSSSNMRRYKYSDFGTYFLFKKYFLEDRLVFSGGLRVSKIKTDTPEHGGDSFSETKAIPAFGVSYMAREWLKLRANYARGYRAGSVNEMYGEGATMVGRNSFVLPAMGNRLVNTVWLEQNPALKPQESDSFEIGVDVERENFSGSLTLFYSLFKNKIEREDHAFPAFNYADAVAKWPWVGAFSNAGYWNMMYAGRPAGFPQPPAAAGGAPSPYAAWAQYVNYGDARQLGVEWNLRWDVGRELGLPVSVTPYSTGTFLPKSDYTSGPDNGMRMRKVPKWFTSYGFEVESEDIGLWVDVNFLTKSSQRATSMTSDASAPEWQPGYTVMNVRATKTILESEDKGTLSAVFLMSNVTDVYYESYPSYPLPGRGFYLGLRYDYK
ncbi:MAG: TonB-dependent receptor [Deltaproteobacteria bacterium]|nr:TonB-dependent receptor [Deltaproteobacteria bacterium]